MENASKALIIAGGILLAMMILVMLIYVGTSMTNNAESQNTKLLAQQTAEFNKSYLAYDKTKMYGIDVITVVNKAIDYNLRLGESEEKYKINIILETKQDFNTTRKRIIQEGNGKVIEQSDQIEEISLEKGIYQLFEREGSIKINDSIMKFFTQEPDTKNVTEYATEIVTTFTYSALTNFKTAIFKCESVEYNEETGRIKSMTFKQI